MKRVPVDLIQLKADIESERARIALIPFADRSYKVLCRLLTKLKYHSNTETRLNTISRAVAYNNELKYAKSQFKNTIQIVS